METLNYGIFEIAPDVQRTKDYYSDLTPAQTQAARNFSAYCANMPEEEKMFFESLGIDPEKVFDICGVYSKKEKTFECYGFFYFCGEYVQAEFPEEIIDGMPSIVGTETEENSYNIGNFEITFQTPVFDEENSAPDGFRVLRFNCYGLPWLLDEKPEKELLKYEEPKKWEIHKRLFEAAKEKKAMLDYKRGNIKYIEETLTESGLEFRKMGKREYERYRTEWVKRMTPGFADEKRVRIHCLGEGCFLWHLFSFSHAHAVEGSEASAEFDATKKCKSILLCSYEEKGYVLSHTYKLKAETLELFTDVIITSANFAWTYCKTHEMDCGPYFYRPKKK
jgi:hypothetical protein